MTRAVAVFVAVAACARFHPERLPGAPADATFAVVDGVHVRYRDSGRGPAVVLIHGFGASSDAWLPVIPALAPDHRVIAVDLKGFGWTSRPEGDYSPAAQAALVWRVLDQLAISDVAVVGHSWGASVALAMAAAQPARVRRVALYAAYVYDDQVPSFFRWAQTGLGGPLFDLFYRERIEERAALAYFDDAWLDQSRIEAIEAELARPGTTAAALAAARAHHFDDLHQRLRGFDRPVLLLWGQDDQVTPIRFGHRLVQELARAELKSYPRCGHIPMVEAPSSTRDLQTFLTEPSSEAAPAAPTKAAPSSAARPPTPLPSITIRPRADLAALGRELTPRRYAASRERAELTIAGSLRLRDAQLYNFDLDRGLDARGRPLFPVPLAGGQRLDSADLRARTDIAVYAPGVGVAVKARIDWLDNVALGGDPELANATPAATTGQRPTAVVVERAWGEALTPFGTLAIGRMGAHFGLGIAANGGDCADCDSGDAADRAAFVMPVAGHLVAFAYDIAARGPFTRSRDGGSAIALEPSDRAAGPTAAILKVHVPAALARRAAAGLTSVEYAAYVSRRTQARDVPASYLPIAAPRDDLGAADLVARDFAATATGAWLRVTRAGLRLEAEVAFAVARVGQPSLVPGAEITTPVTSRQLGLAVQSELALGRSRIGVDAGFASGDDAPGFGAFPGLGEAAPAAGSFDGAQADPPRDVTIDNFRFHPDFQIDQILFRDIIGAITDAIYLRPHALVRLFTIGGGSLEAGCALIASWAIAPTSTPSGQRALGVEIDPTLRYTSRDGFALGLDYGVLLPGAAFDGSELAARPAHALRLRAEFTF